MNGETRMTMSELSTDELLEMVEYAAEIDAEEGSDEYHDALDASEILESRDSF